MLLPPPTTSESDSLGFRSVPTCPLCRAFICKHCSDTAGSLSRWAKSSQPFFWRPFAGFGCQVPWRGVNENSLWKSVGRKGENTLAGNNLAHPSEERSVGKKKKRKTTLKVENKVPENVAWSELRGSWAGARLLWLCPYQHVDWCGTMCPYKLASGTLGPLPPILRNRYWWETVA